MQKWINANFIMKTTDCPNHLRVSHKTMYVIQIAGNGTLGMQLAVINAMHVRQWDD